MSAPVLTVIEQKAAISGKKKKKKTIKNVLNKPNNLKIKPCIVGTKEARKLSQILERLLPIARLPLQHTIKDSEDSKKQSTNHLHSSSEAKNKRTQLSLGVNDLNRSIRKDLISAVLFASDIEPKFLIHHLCLLCDHYKIPCVHLTDLREITKNSLGFPCIAVGFKKNFSDFSEAVEEIQSIFQTKNFTSNDINLETEVSESNEDEIVDSDIHNKLEKSDKTPFTYLYRCTREKRVFVPEGIYNNKNETASKSDFLALEKSDIEPDTKLPQQGISARFITQKGNLKKLEELGSSGTDDEDLEVPKKKVKKDWLIDKTGNKRNIKYHPANLMRVPSNPSRRKKNKRCSF